MKKMLYDIKILKIQYDIVNFLANEYLKDIFYSEIMYYLIN